MEVTGESQTMFELKFYVEDKNLGEVLGSLAGKAINLEHKYLVNASVEGGKVEARSGDVVDAFVKWARDRGARTLTTKDAAGYLSSIGRSRNRAYYVTTEAIRRKLLSRSGRGRFSFVTKRRGK